ncbi:MAG TPA: MoaD/ThiS family protein [Chitinophagaceae bacterium]|jgi:molybdopterin converting factor small subunit|nr:MoaD/ThiS family protein [Chitinophagaceae bacterium]
MPLNIIIFGQLTDITGSSLSLDNISDTDNLVRELNKRYPALAGKKYVVAVDKQVVTTNTVLTNNDTVALLPPFSGG